jgi:hypothetical protein
MAGRNFLFVLDCGIKVEPGSGAAAAQSYWRRLDSAFLQGLL